MRIRPCSFIRPPRFVCHLYPPSFSPTYICFLVLFCVYYYTYYYYIGLLFFFVVVDGVEDEEPDEVDCCLWQADDIASCSRSDGRLLVRGASICSYTCCLLLSCSVSILNEKERKDSCLVECRRRGDGEKRESLFALCQLPKREGRKKTRTKASIEAMLPT